MKGEFTWPQVSVLKVLLCRQSPGERGGVSSV